jgi:tRNA threonylcarbamoyladenosine biosynthesis protein TsaB
MRTAQKFAGDSARTERLMLGVDTCGDRGSVALGLLIGQGFEVLEQIELEGRSYSATLVAAVSDLLKRSGVELKKLNAIVAVNGPGSFTGVRIGLSAVKGLAEVARIPVVAVSRLEVLAAKAGTEFAALDAHRQEVFLRIGGAGSAGAKELLAGVEELALMRSPGREVAVCDDAAAALLSTAWPDVELLRGDAPTAADALCACASRGGEIGLVDLELLDGHYLRRPDAEIFADERSDAAKAQSL